LDLSEIKKQCNKIERHLIALEAERDTLLALLEEQKLKLFELETKKEHNKKGQIFLRLKAADTRIQALASIEEIVTAALREIYGEDYIFTLEMKEVSSKEGENTGLFTILPCIEKVIDGKRVKRPIKGSNGGGVLEIISVLLRFAFGTYNNYNGIYVLDEALSAVSKDGVMEKLLIFLDRYITELGLQVILITHSAEKFSQISTLNYLVYKEDGIAKMKLVTRDDILEMQNFDVSAVI
jgi:DNA repair ATPase RecN